MGCGLHEPDIFKGNHLFEYFWFWNQDVKNPWTRKVHKVEGFSSGAATIHLDVAESAGLGNEKPQID